jgi:hypothetical protein
VKVEDNKAEYIADLQGEDRVSFGLQGFSDSPKDYDFRVVNKRAQLEVHIVGDHPLANASDTSVGLDRDDQIALVEQRIGIGRLIGPYPRYLRLRNRAKGRKRVCCSCDGDS